MLHLNYLKKFSKKNLFIQKNPMQGREHHLRIIKEAKCGCQEEIQPCLFVGLPSVPHCFKVAGRELLYHLFALSHPPVNGLLSLLYPRSLPPSPQFKMAYEPQYLNVFLGFIFLCNSHMYMWNKTWMFLLINLSHINFIISLARRIRKLGGKLCLVPHKIIL